MMDAKSQKILAILGDRTKTRSYKDTDICVASKMTKDVVRRRLPRLMDDGLVEEFWKGEHGPYYRIPGNAR